MVNCPCLKTPRARIVVNSCRRSARVCFAAPGSYLIWHHLPIDREALYWVMYAVREPGCPGLASLARDIVGPIVRGEAPEGLTARRLIRPWPVRWDEQHRSY
jgi:hypothetical protein